MEVISLYSTESVAEQVSLGSGLQMCLSSQLAQHALLSACGNYGAQCNRQARTCGQGSMNMQYICTVKLSYISYGQLAVYPADEGMQNHIVKALRWRQQLGWTHVLHSGGNCIA